MNDDEPIAIARSFFEAIRRKRWKRAASLLHPDTRELVLKAVSRRIDDDPNARLTVDTIRRHDPEMPIECAEHQVRRAREHNARNPWYRVSMGVDDAEQLRAMDATELTARLIEGADIRVRPTRQTLSHGTDGDGSDRPRPKFSARWGGCGPALRIPEVPV